MSISRRMFLRTSIVGLASARLSPGLRLLGSLMAAPSQVKIGVTDWNLRQEGKLEAVALAKKIGFDGVEVSIGIGAERLPLGDKALQQHYIEQAKSHKLPIASTCLNVLHKNVLKSDRLAQRWVADSIPITKNLGAKVILLPFFGKGSLKTQQEMDYVADYLKEIAPAAEKAQVVLGVENTISAEDNVF
jgi:L-ribulose-5-phosphate 3-epimerase